MKLVKSTNKAGIVVSSFKLPFWQRVKVLFTGKIWMVMDTKYKEPMKVVFTVHKKMIYKDKAA